MASEDLHKRLTSVSTHMTLLSTSYQDIVTKMREQNDDIINKQRSWHDSRTDFELKFTQMSKKLLSYPDNEEGQLMQEVLADLQQAVLDFDSEQATLEEMRGEFDSLITQFLDQADDVIGAANGDIPQPANGNAPSEMQTKLAEADAHNEELFELITQYETDMENVKEQSRVRESELTELLEEAQTENQELTERNSTLLESLPRTAITVSSPSGNTTELVDMAGSEFPNETADTQTEDSKFLQMRQKKALYRSNTKTDWDADDLELLKNDMMQEMNKMNKAHLVQRMDEQDALRWSATFVAPIPLLEDDNSNALSTPKKKSPRNSVTMDIGVKVKDIFVLFDKNFDGVLEEEDLRQMLSLFKSDYSVDELLERFGPRCEFIKFLRKMQDFRDMAVVILQTLTNYLTNRIRDVFFIFDKEQTGSLDKRDLENMFVDTNLDVDEYFDPPCTFTDFLFGFKRWYTTDSANPHPLLNLVEAQTESRMRRVFEFFDDHKNGLLSLDNCKEILGIVGEDRSQAQALFHPPVQFPEFFEAWIKVDRPLAASILLALESHISAVSWDEKTGRPGRSLFRSGTVTNWSPEQLELLKNEMRAEYSDQSKQKLGAMVEKQEDLRWSTEFEDDKNSLAKDVRLQVLSVFVFFDSDMDSELQMVDLKRMLEAVENKELSEEHVRAHFEPPCDFIKFLKKIQQLRSHALVILQKLQNYIENKIRDVFFIFDEDNDGSLSYGDVEHIFGLGSSECDIENLFEPPCDVNAFISGFRIWLRQDDVDPHPILQEVTRRIERRLKSVFEFFDKSKTGQLSEDDCREILLAVGEDPSRVGTTFRPPVSFDVFVQAWRTIARPLAASILVALENYIDKRAQYHIPENAEVDGPRTSSGNLAIPHRLYRSNTATDWNPEDLDMLKDEMRGQMMQMAKSEVARRMDEQENLRWAGKKKPDPKAPEAGPAAARNSIEEVATADDAQQQPDRASRAYRRDTNTSWSSVEMEALRTEMMEEMQGINKKEVKRLLDNQEQLRWGHGHKHAEPKKIRFDPEPDIRLVPASHQDKKRKDLPPIPSQSDIEFSAEAPKSPTPDRIGDAAQEVVSRLVRANTRTNWDPQELEMLKSEMRAQMAQLNKKQLADKFEQQDNLRWQRGESNSVSGLEDSFETESVVNEQMQDLQENPAFVDYKKELDKELAKQKEHVEYLERQLSAERRRSESQGDSRLTQLRQQLEHERDQAILETQSKQNELMLQAQMRYDEQISEMNRNFEVELEDMKLTKMTLIENTATQMEKLRQMVLRLSQMSKS